MNATPTENLQPNGLKGVFAGRRQNFSLRMAPMIDVIFLLLIFFLVAAKWRPEENFLPFKLPAAQAQDNVVGKSEPLEIIISATTNGCNVQIGRFEPVGIEEAQIEAGLAVVMEKLQKCMLEQQRFVSDPVEIVCADRVKWDYVAQIYNMFFAAGLTDITFVMTE